ncbi:circadian-associated transcriptional repressor-like isoform X1 [Acanthochromis polyacanthus]|uniref:circadian-associated transcriptional repressor-like isoform X1 n=1 Tax=Acanthochromis polyacanthus TaxID=80966 RepID=UPI002233E46A|nr:circadian-associated transcriptional repressor-like isoform X1 [Acanthochromis polyacanthus]
MSTSDSDFSVDWFASDEDEYDDEPKTPSPETDELLPSSSSGCCCCSAAQRSSKDGVGVSPVQGFTSVCPQLPVEKTHRLDRKRKHGEESDNRSNTESELFFHKCLELQSYIQPLNSILQNLRSGRYSQRLSSFQENVAVDRIQRILGVLQNPDKGGRFLSIILKIEEMLHTWFPHIKPNQAADGSSAKKLKQHRHGDISPPSDVVSASSNSSTHLKWLHTSPVFSLKTPEASPGRLTSCSQEVTQDAAVSSSTDWTGQPPCPVANPRLRHGPPLFKISSPCLERLLQATESIIAPRTAGDGSVLS